MGDRIKPESVIGMGQNMHLAEVSSGHSSQTPVVMVGTGLRA